MSQVSLRLSCGNYAWPNVRHSFVLDLIAELGFDAVDLGLFSGYSVLEPEQVRDDVDRAAELVGGELATRGLHASDVFGIPDMGLVRMSLSNPDPRDQRESAEFFHDLLRFTTRLGCKHMTLLPGTVLDGEDAGSSLRRASEQLRWRVDEAATAGVTLGVEPHSGSNLEEPERVLELIESTPGLTLTLDYGHFVYAGVEQEATDVLLDHASHLHCRGGRAGMVQTRLVDNTIDYARIVSELQNREFNGYASVEYVHDDRPGCSECDNLQEVLAFREHLQGLLRGRARR